MKRGRDVVILLVVALAQFAVAQPVARLTKFVDGDIAVGNTEGTFSVSFNLDETFGKKGRLVAGLGARFTSYLGKNQYYVTAPAKLTSGSTGPGVFFKENIPANMDTFLVKTAQMNALNIHVTLGYNFSSRLMVLFNIDGVGFTFGKNTTGNYINGAQGSLESARPTGFNVLLISDNDLGTLNSQLFARYLLNEKWGVKAGAQFLFTEYTTDRDVQLYPEPNDRFRNKSLMFMAGVSYKL